MRTIVSMFLTISFIASADDWPNWRGPNHNGISQEKVPKANFSEIAWRKKIGVGFSSMSVSKGRLFALGSTGKKRGNEETFY